MTNKIVDLLACHDFFFLRKFNGRTSLLVLDEQKI